MALSGITDQITSDASPQCLSLASSCMQDGAGSMNEKLMQTVPHSTSVESPHDRYHEVAADLARRGWTVREAFFASELVDTLRAEIDGCHEAEGLRRAAIGRGEGTQVRDETRGDYIAWLDGAQATAAQQAFLRELESLRLALNQTLFLGLFEYEGHLALYPPGAFYRRHLDRHRDSDARIVSCVVYLNSEWRPADGGELRLFLEEERVIDVAPRGGTLACFLSGSIEHEVLATRVPRYSITGWLRRREE